MNLHEISNPYEENIPLSKSELLEQLKKREDALETIVYEDIDEAKDWKNHKDNVMISGIDIHDGVIPQ